MRLEKRKNGWAVIAKNGRVLGNHKTKKSARKQIAAKHAR